MPGGATKADLACTLSNTDDAVIPLTQQLLNVGHQAMGPIQIKFDFWYEAHIHHTCKPAKVLTCSSANVPGQILGLYKCQAQDYLVFNPKAAQKSTLQKVSDAGGCWAVTSSTNKICAQET